MKFAYEQMMEHEFKWLEEEKQEYVRSGTKVLPEDSLHSIIAESREQDAKEMMAINEALNKFNLNENDIGGASSSDATAQANKRSIDAMLEDSSASSTTTTTSNNNTTTTTSEEVAGVRSDKKYKIVAGNETNVDNVTNKNVNSNNE